MDQVRDQERASEVLQPEVVGKPIAVLESAQVRMQREAASTSITVWSDQVGDLVAAMAKSQAAFGPIEKNKTAVVTSRKEGGRGYTYRYADLDAVLAVVRPVLAGNGIAIFQMPIVGDGKVTVTTELRIGEQFVRNRLSLSCGADPQAVGSAISYARRYALQALTGVAPSDDDDDGATASESVDEDAIMQAPPRPAPRRSEQARPSPAPIEEHAGIVAKTIKARNSDTMGVQLEDGWKFKVRDEAMKARVLAAESAKARLTWVVHPVAAGTDDIPVLVDIRQQ